MVNFAFATVIWVRLLGSLEDRFMEYRCLWSVVSTNAARYQMAPFCSKLRGPEANGTTQTHCNSPVTSSLDLFGHIAPMDDNTDAKRILSPLPPEDWRRPRGHPCTTWLSNIQQDLRSHNLTLPEAMDMTQNRSLWRLWSMYGATQSWVADQKRRCRYGLWLCRKSWEITVISSIVIVTENVINWSTVETEKTFWQLSRLCHLLTFTVSV